MDRSKRRTNVSNVPALFSAEIVLADEKTPPAQIRLLQSGLNHTDRTSDSWDAGPHLFDELAAAMVMGSYEQDRQARADKKLRLQIDWNHGMLDPKADRTRGASAGSFIPAVINGELWATDISWTEDGARDVVSRAYNYESPAFSLDYGEDGACRPRKLVNFALVNLAGLKDAQELMAASAALLNAREQPEEPHMAMDEKLETELRTRIATLTTERDSAVTELASARGAASDVVALGAAVGVQASAPNAERLSAVSGLVALKADVLKATGAETPAAALATVTSLVALKADLLKATGAKDAASAIGTIEGALEKAKGYDKLATESAERETVALMADLKGAIEKGASEGKLDVPGKSFYEEAALAKGGGKPTREAVTWLSARIAAMPKIMTMVGDPEAARSREGVVALSAQELAFIKSQGKDPAIALKAKQQIEDQKRSRAEGAATA